MKNNKNFEDMTFTSCYKYGFFVKKVAREDENKKLRTIEKMCDILKNSDGENVFFGVINYGKNGTTVTNIENGEVIKLSEARAKGYLKSEPREDGTFYLQYRITADNNDVHVLPHRAEFFKNSPNLQRPFHKDDNPLHNKLFEFIKGKKDLTYAEVMDIVGFLKEDNDEYISSHCTDAPKPKKPNVIFDYEMDRF